METPKRVLLIDNDEGFLQAAGRALMTHGYGVEEARDGLEGIEKAIQDPPDVAVVDLIMPRVGGNEVVAFFKRNPRLCSLPIIVLSGVLADDPALVEGLDVDLVLTKGPMEETVVRLLAGLRQVGTGAPRRAQSPPLQDEPGPTPVRELLEIKRDLEAVLEGAGAGLIELDPTGRVAYANGRIEDLLGLDRASLLGTELASVVPAAGRTPLRTLLARFEGDRGPVSRAMTVGVEGRTLRVVLTSVWRAGAPRSIVATVMEIPPQGEADSRPARLTQYLCHEMRSSLLIIEGYLRSLVGKGGDLSRAGQTERLLFLARETARLLRLVGDASAFDRAIRELPDHEMALLEFENVFKDALSGVTALAVSQGIEVSVTAPEESPAVWGNHDQLLQVLYNLLLNALKFTPRGGSVWVEVQLTEGEIVTTVADTGRGIAPGDLKEILAQAERPELFLPLKGRRVGLGLAIAFQIIRAHRGRLFAESAPGVGSRFSFTLPRWSEAGPAPGPAY